MDLTTAFAEWDTESLTLSNLAMYAAYDVAMREEEGE